MPLKANSKAPDFVLKTSENTEFSLFQALEKTPVILFFYPKNFTTVCTQEVCAFRDDFTFFQERKIQVVGVSADSVASHERFSSKHQLPYILISDSDRKVARLYDALYPFELLARRVTYLIDQNRKIVSVFNSLAMAQTHIEDLKDKIRKMEIGGQLGRPKE